MSLKHSFIEGKKAPGNRDLEAESQTTKTVVSGQDTLWARWRYSGGKRDLRLDMLRGFAVLVMIIDHIGGNESWLYSLTAHDLFFVSAAEPFVFVSGLVLGIVYAGVIVQQGLRAGLVKLAKRAALLYALTVSVGIVFAVGSLQFGLPWAPSWGSEGLGGFVLSILTFQRVYYLTDVLMLYTFLVACAAPVLVLLAKKLTCVAVAGSVLLWLAWQLWPSQVDLPWTIQDNHIFHLAAWQLLFFAGLVLGYHRKGIESLVRKAVARVPLLLPSLLVTTGIIVAAAIAVYMWVQSTPATTDDLLLAHLFEKGDVRLGRLLIFAPFATFAFLLLTLFWMPLVRALGWLLMPLGQRALPAFCLHLAIVLLVTSLASASMLNMRTTALDNTLVQLSGIALLWLLIRADKPLRRVAGVGVRWMSHVFRRGEAERRVIARTWKQTAARVALAGAGVAMLSWISVSAVEAFTPGHEVEAILARLDAKGKMGTTAIPVTTVTANQRVAIPIVTVVADSLPKTLSIMPDMVESPTSSGGAYIGATPANLLTQGVERGAFWSDTLGQAVQYLVYLPPDYYKTGNTARYPVLYMLHGMSGSFEEWANYGLLSKADEMMRAGQIAPFIIILPYGDQSYWVDAANNGPRWGTYLVRDVVGHMDKYYRTEASRDSRAIGGLSMGAHAALQLSINYPEVFGIAGAHSPSLHTRDTIPSFFGDEAYFEAHDPAHLYAAKPEIARTLQIWIDLGAQDPWLPIITAFHNQLQSEGISHQWYTPDGGHMAEYWSGQVGSYLNFYSSAFSAGAHITGAASQAP